MIESEIKDWLGIPYEPWHIKKSIRDEMGPYPYPETDRQHIIVFQAFLRGMGPHGKRDLTDILEPTPDV